MIRNIGTLMSFLAIRDHLIGKESETGLATLKFIKER